MYNEKKNNITVWVFAAVIVILALLVVFYKSRPETTEQPAEQKTAEKNVEQPKPAEKNVEQPKSSVETFHETSQKPSETHHGTSLQQEQRKNAEMRENEETVGDAIPESNPAPWSIWKCWEGIREFPEIWTRVLRESWMKTSFSHGQGTQLPPPGSSLVSLIH